MGSIQANRYNAFQIYRIKSFFGFKKALLIVSVNKKLQCVYQSLVVPLSFSNASMFKKRVKNIYDKIRENVGG
jgi:hypothetical protein